MKKCTKCQAKLTPADVQKGKCPQCDAALVEAPAGGVAGGDERRTIEDAGMQGDAADQVDPQSGAADTRKDTDELRQTIKPDSDRETVDDPLLVPDADASSQADDEGAKTVSDIHQTIEDEPVVQGGAGRSTVPDVPGKAGGPTDEAQSPQETVEDTQVSPGEVQKTIADVAATAAGKDIGKTVSGDPGKTIEIDGSDAGSSASPGQDIGRTVTDAEIQASDVSKTVAGEIGKTIDESQMGQAAGGQTIEQSGPVEGDDPSKTVVGDIGIGKTIDESQMGQAAGGQTIEQSGPVEGDDPSKTVVGDVGIGKTIDESQIGQAAGGQTIEQSGPVEGEDPSKTVVGDVGIGKTIDESQMGQAAGGQTIEQSGPIEGDDPSKTVGGDVGIGKTIDESQIGPVGGQTIDLDQHDPVDPTRQTVLDGEINKTIEVPGTGDGKGTVSDTDVNATVDLSGEQPKKDGTVSDKNMLLTVDSTEIVVAANIDKTWAGSIDEEATPMTSLKANLDDDPIGTKSDLVIQPRSFRKPEEPRRRQSIDYDLLDLLGEGGMGMVYAARQASIDRTVAIKMLKPKTAQDEVQRCKFLAEAVVTGDLEHPNIVPIYDLGRDAEGALFYAMKRVQGTPWDEAIQKKSLSENLEILMKVADAMAFSHSRGIIHRDLKPENVMLGGFGEVLVMDWGLAIPTDRRLIGGLQPSTSMGGTPAYMAPEMATGPFETIGTHSDVYLLGAILYEIVTGKPPHTGKDVMKCLFAAAKNKIQETDETNELVGIALQAMDTDVKERHASVTDFQDAIREYLSHSESIVLSDHAENDLEKAGQSDDYQDFARALFGFQQAVELWDGNDPAKEGLGQAQVAYARSAKEKGDFDLGASLLDEEVPDQVELLSEIREAKREVEARKQRLKTAKRAIMALAAVFFIAITCALFFVLQAQAAAETARDEAIESEKVAVQEKVAADRARQKAEDERKKAEAAALAEAAAKDEALAAKKKAEDAALAEAKAKDDAVLAQMKAEEERKKAEDATKAALAAKEAEAKEREKAVAAAEAEAKAKDAAVLAQMKAEEQRKKAEEATKTALAAKEAEALERKKAEAAKTAALAAQKAEAAEREKAVLAQLKAQEEEKKAKIATTEAKRQAYTALISAAAAKIDENAFDSARQLLNDCAPEFRNWEWGRLWYVCNQSIAAMRVNAEIAAIDYNPTRDQIATGGLDGMVRIWEPETDMTGKLAHPGKLLWHAADAERKAVWQQDAGGEVRAVAYSPDGKWLAVGTSNQDGLLQVWDLEAKMPVFHVPSGKREGTLPQDAHTQDVVSVQFNAAGTLLLTSSFDHTAKVWDVSDPGNIKLRTTLRGHAWWVWNARFSPATKDDPAGGKRILTVSDDGNAIVWTDDTGNWAKPENIRNSPKFRGHHGPIFAGAFSPDGERVATAGYDQRILLWNPADLKEFDHQRAATAFGSSLQVNTNQADQSQILEGHTGSIRSLTFSQDGKLLLTSGQDNTIRVWDTKGRGTPVVLRGHGKAVQGCTISPNNQWIASGSLDGTARVWDLGRYEEQRVLRGKVLDAHEDSVLSAYFSGDGQQIVTASRDSTAKTWTIKGDHRDTFFEGHTLREGHLFRAAQAVFFGEDKYLATSAVDNTVRIWDVSKGTQIELLENTGRNAAIAISSDGKIIVTGSSDKKLNYAQVWEWTNGQKAQVKYRLADHGATVTVVALSADEKYIATGDANGHCNLWNASDGKLVHRLAFHLNGLTAMAFLKDSSRLLTADNQGRVVQWDMNSFQPLRHLEMNFGRSIMSMDTAQLPDSKKRVAVVCATDGHVELVDVDAGKRGRLRTLVSKYPIGTINNVSFSHDGSSVIAVATPIARVLTPTAGGPAQTLPAAAVHIFEAETGNEVEFAIDSETQGPFLFLGGGGVVSSATFNSDGSRVVAVGGNRARMWEVNPVTIQENREVMRFRPHGPIATARFSPDGKYIITGSWDTTIKIWNTETKQNEHTLKDLHSRAVNSVRFSQDGTLALSSSDDRTAKLWDVKTGKVKMIFGGKDDAHTDAVMDAIFLPGEEQVATASRDKTVRIWNVADGSTAKKLEADADPAPLLCLASSYDGLWIAAGGEKDAKIWSVTSGQVVTTLAGHTAAITSVEFSDAKDKSHRLLTGSEDFTAKVWDSSKLYEKEGNHQVNEIMTLKAHKQAVTSVSFSPDGKYCLTGSQDGTAIVWLTSPWGKDVVSAE